MTKIKLWGGEKSVHVNTSDSGLYTVLRIGKKDETLLDREEVFDLIQALRKEIGDE